MKAILLAAGQGTRLRPLTDDRPKCMVEVDDRPLLHWQLDTLVEAGVDDIVVVRGYQRTHLQGPGFRTIDSTRWETTNMLESLRCARAEISGEILVCYTDILYETSVIQTARASSADVGVVIDHDWEALWRRRMDDPLDDAETLRLDANGRIVEIGQRAHALAPIDGQFVGVLHFSAAGSELLRHTLDEISREDEHHGSIFGGRYDLKNAYTTDLLTEWIDQNVPVMEIPIAGGWTEIDSQRDLQVAQELMAEGQLAMGAATGSLR